MNDRFRYQRHRFSAPSGGGSGFPGLTPMVQRLLIIHAAAFVGQIVFATQGMDVYGLFSVSVSGVFGHGYFWQPFTYMFLHANFMHLAFNMFALWMFGGSLESAWGSRRFLRFYLLSGFGAGLIILVYHALMDPNTVTLGASGAVYGILTAFSLNWPDRRIMLLFPPIPMKAIYLIPVLFGLQLVMSGGSNISHIGHLGGVIVAFFLMRNQALPYLRGVLGLKSVRVRWHRYKMRNRLRAVRRDEWDRRNEGSPRSKKSSDDDRSDDDRPTYH